jgi:hypothetical protein
VFEAPVEIDYRFSSQVDPGQAMGILTDSLAIFYRQYVLGSYGPKHRRPATAWGDPSLSVSEDDTTIAIAPTAVDRALRILIVNWRDIRNPEAGGAEVYTHEVARRWDRAGHDVTLLTSRFDGVRSKETVDGVRVRRVGRLRRGTFHLAVQHELARLDGFDVVVDEINTIPFFAPLWNRGETRTVVLVHQLAGDVWDAGSRSARCDRPPPRATDAVGLPERAGRHGLGVGRAGSRPSGSDPCDRRRRGAACRTTTRSCR